MAKYEVNEKILDNEFNVYLRLAESLVSKMRKFEDRRIADKYIRECLRMKNSEQIKVKFHRNRFFRYFLKTMRKTVELQADIHIKKSTNEDGSNEQVNDNEFRQWSANRKSYVSAKIIPGFGTLIYMATTDSPQFGWDENGFAHFPPEDISDVTTNASNANTNQETDAV